MTEYKELINIVEEIEKITKEVYTPTFTSDIECIKNIVSEIGKSWSGSWLGYHSTIYYRDFTTPPPGMHFSIEWGARNTFAVEGTVGSWIEYKFDDVKNHIYKKAGNPDINKAKEVSQDVNEKFDEFKSEFDSILTMIDSTRSDTFLTGLKNKAKEIEAHSFSSLIDAFQPKGTQISRDSLAITQGLKTPPHIFALAEVLSIEQPFDAMKKLSIITKKAALHINRKYNHKKKEKLIGTKVFIGHGNSTIWKELKDFIQDRLKLPWDEFNRVPIAGVTNVARLSEMLCSATIAFILLTGEDEQSDGKLHARLNVIHEAGLFQGRLGFTKAIILLEDGCEEFSNIEGLGQIRFPKSNIKAVFEEIRHILEREKII